MKSLLTSAFTGLLAFTLAGPAAAAVQEKEIEYQDGEVKLRGYLAWDDALEGKRPGVLVVHEWWGLNDYARKRARMLAELGYTAFALDMYGEGRATEHGKQAKEWMEQVMANVELWRRRAGAGLEVLKGQATVNPAQLAAVGYCFGGGTVMQLVYGGADLKAVASFHGPLPPPPEGTAIKAKVYAAHGNADSFVPAERVSAFRQALDRAGADWFMLVLGGAKHSFTNPDADKAGIEGLAYDAGADRRSWAVLKQFLAESFAAR